MKKFLTGALFIIGLSLVSGPASAQSAENAIKARQAQMQLYSFYLGIIAAMVKGEVEYDAKAAQAAADGLNAAVNLDASAMWPQGSDNTNADLKVKTRAKPEIWSTYPAVVEKSNALKEGTAKLASVASDGLDALKGAIGAAGAGCKGCHETFRAPAN